MIVKAVGLIVAVLVAAVGLRAVVISVRGESFGHCLLAVGGILMIALGFAGTLMALAMMAGVKVAL